MNAKFHEIPMKDYFTDLISKDVDIEPNNPAFRCFKNKYHVYPLTKFMFMLSMGCWAVILGIMFPWSIVVLWIPLCYFLITTYALRQKRAGCMWPAIIHSILAVLIWLSGTIVMFTTALFSTQSFLDTFGQGHHQQFIVRFLIVLMIKSVIILAGVYLIYQVVVFNLCRKYFDHIRIADVPRASQEEATELKVIQGNS